MPKALAGMDDLLLRGAWFPVTRTVNFLRADLRSAVETFADVRGRVVLDQTGVPLSSREVRGSLGDRLAELPPLVAPLPDRDLFLPVVADDGTAWTAHLNNSIQGIGAEMAIALFAARGITGVSVTESPHTYDASSNAGWWGQRVITVVAPDSADTAGFRASSVGVQVVEGGRWRHIVPGAPLPFRDPSRSSARRVADRFTHEDLVQCAAHFGLHPFDAAFYETSDRGTLVEDTGPRDFVRIRTNLDDVQTFADRLRP